MSYLNGEYGLSTDKAKAREWFSKAAEQNNSYAQLQLGAMYVSGEGGVQDLAEGLKLVTLSAMNGNEDALQLLVNLAEGSDGNSAIQYVLGSMYFAGNGVTADRIEARRWLLKARNQGDEDASFLLGLISADEDDYETALAYITEAAKKGHKDAIELLSSVQSSTKQSSGRGLIDYAGEAVMNAAKNRMANRALDAIWEFLTH